MPSRVNLTFPVVVWRSMQVTRNSVVQIIVILRATTTTSKNNNNFFSKILVYKIRLNTIAKEKVSGYILSQ